MTEPDELTDEVLYATSNAIYRAITDMHLRPANQFGLVISVLGRLLAGFNDEDRVTTLALLQKCVTLAVETYSEHRPNELQ